MDPAAADVGTVRFVTVCHLPRTLQVVVYKGVPVNELEQLLSSSFKTGNRTIVGFENNHANACVGLSVASFCPAILQEGVIYTLLFGDGKIQHNSVPYDFTDATAQLNTFVASLHREGVISDTQNNILHDMIASADRALLLANTFFRMNQNVTELTDMLVHVSGIGGTTDHRRLLARLNAVNECVHDAGLSSTSAPRLQRLLLVGHGPTQDAFIPFEKSHDSAQLRVALDRIFPLYVAAPADDEKAAELDSSAPADDDAEAMDDPKTHPETIIDSLDLVDSEAALLKQMVMAGDARVMAGFEVYRRDHSMEELKDTLLHICRLTSAMPPTSADVCSRNDAELSSAQDVMMISDAFLLLVDGLVRADRISGADGAWLRGRRAAGDADLCDAVTQYEVDGDHAQAVQRLLTFNEGFVQQRVANRQMLAQIIEDMPASKLTPLEQRQLLDLAQDGNDVVLSAYEVFAVELDEAELHETLLMVLRTADLQGSPPPQATDMSMAARDEMASSLAHSPVLGVSPPPSLSSLRTSSSDEAMVSSFAALLQELTASDAISSEGAQVLLRLAQVGEPQVLAAFQVYRGVAPHDTAEFVDTAGRYLKKRMRKYHALRQQLRQALSDAEIAAKESAELIAFFESGAGASVSADEELAAALDAARVLDAASDNNAMAGGRYARMRHLGLLGLLEQAMDIVVAEESKRAWEERTAAAVEELSARVAAMEEACDVSRAEGSALRGLIGTLDDHIMAAHDAFSRNGDDDDFRDTLQRIAKRVEQGQPPFSRLRSATFFSDVLDAVASMDDIDDDARAVLLQCVEDYEPTVQAAVQMYAETNDEEEFVETLRVIAHTRLGLQRSPLSPVLSVVPSIPSPMGRTEGTDAIDTTSPGLHDASAITVGSDATGSSLVSPGRLVLEEMEGAEALLSPAYGGIGNGSMCSVTAESQAQAQARSAAFARAVEQLSKGPDSLTEQQLDVLRDLFNEGDMMMQVGLDFYTSNVDMAELLDTLRTIVRVRCD